MDLMDKIVSLAKRRGFVFPGSEIYGGIAGFWDYGPLGVELKNNIKREWWRSMVYQRDDVVGLDAAIVMNPKVWEASGHLKSFTDPLVECKKCHKRFRLDKYQEFIKSAESQYPNKVTLDSSFIEIFICDNGEWHDSKFFTAEKKFNLMTEVLLGVTEPKQTAYLRGEITQGVFVNFQNVVDSSRVKIPFGIAQIGKAFRNEITPGNFIFRSREFEQMELEFFTRPDEKEGEKWFAYWKQERLQWYLSLGMAKQSLRFREHAPDERAHYARKAFDIEYHAPFGWSEFEGIHHRGDWDLDRHKLKYKDNQTGDEYTPWVIETSGGVDRAILFFLLNAYHEEPGRVILRFHPKLAPYKVAVFPLVRNKPEITAKAKQVFDILKTRFRTGWDDRGNIGKRYYSQDEIGTPWCVTVDYDTLEDGTVTVRNRDSANQERVSIRKLVEYINNKLLNC
ncbi:glycine--tRNA ligase [Candidatus Collierbacteria bacterium]|nr:glycine--tRNA ligase [Candidatus Collierbacteria bacterium]